jgi:mono/diheme cytochrome c family protein
MSDERPGVFAMKSVFLFASMAIPLLSAAGMGQNPTQSANTYQGRKIFVSRCAQCHDEDASKKLPDGTTLLLRLAGRKDPEIRLGTRLKKEDERHQVFLYLQPLIERERAAGKEQKTP